MGLGPTNAGFDRTAPESVFIVEGEQETLLFRWSTLHVPNVGTLREDLTWIPHQANHFDTLFPKELQNRRPNNSKYSTTLPGCLPQAEIPRQAAMVVSLQGVRFDHS